MNWTIKQAVDLVRGFPDTNVWQEALMIPGDGEAHVWEIEVRENGKPVDLSGCTVNAWFARDDGNAVYIVGAVEDNFARVTLAQECYAIAGQLRGVLKIAKDGKVMSACETFFTVREPLPNQYVDPGQTIPSIDELLERVEDCEAAAIAAKQAVKDVNTAVTASTAATQSANAAATAANDAAEDASASAQKADEAVENLGDAASAKAAAEAARDAAAQSETNAASSATNAASSATTAETAATTATGKADASASSASAAEQSATDAETAATAAKAVQDNVEVMVETIAKEPTAQDILSAIQAASVDLKKIAEDGNETVREANEEIRVANETERVANETARQTSENQRVGNESERVSDEADRAAAETSRASAETTRVENEETRESAESDREIAENARVTAEQARAAAEAQRVATETTRQAALTAAVNSATTSAASASTSADSAASSATTAQDAQEAVEGFVESIAKEPTAQSILSIMQQELTLLQQIVEEGTGGKGDLNGFSFSRGESGELIISYTNPDDETDTAIATFATKTLANLIAQELASINESLHTIAGTDNTAQTEG